MSKFQNCYPKKVHFHTFQIERDDAYLNIMYLSTKKAKVENIDDFSFNPDIVAFLQYHTDDDTDEAILSSITVSKQYRGRGYAFYLCLKMIRYLHKIGIQTVVLDDDSNAYRQSHNLYTLLGFKYTADAGPEMFADIDTLARTSNFEYFFKKWLKYYNC